MKIKVPTFVVEPFHQKKLSTWYASSTIKTINDLNVDLILNLIKTFAYQTIHSYRTRKRRGRSRYYRARLIYDRVSHFAFRKSLSRFAIRSRIISRCTREKHFKFLARKFSKTILRLPGGIAFMFLKRNCGCPGARQTANICVSDFAAFVAVRGFARVYVHHSRIYKTPPNCIRAPLSRNSPSLVADTTPTTTARLLATLL